MDKLYIDIYIYLYIHTHLHEYIFINIFIYIRTQKAALVQVCIHPNVKVVMYKYIHGKKNVYMHTNI